MAFRWMGFGPAGAPDISEFYTPVDPEQIAMEEANRAERIEQDYQAALTAAGDDPEAIAAVETLRTEAQEAWQPGEWEGVYIPGISGTDWWKTVPSMVEQPMAQASLAREAEYEALKATAKGEGLTPIQEYQQSLLMQEFDPIIETTYTGTEYQLAAGKPGALAPGEMRVMKGGQQTAAKPAPIQLGAGGTKALRGKRAKGIKQFREQTKRRGAGGAQL